VYHVSAFPCLALRLLCIYVFCTWFTLHCAYLILAPKRVFFKIILATKKGFL
jgi:hypothetical protein